MGQLASCRKLGTLVLVLALLLPRSSPHSTYLATIRCFTAIGSAQIDLPQICVLGSQSSVKSSVLKVLRHDLVPIHRLMAFAEPRWS